MATILDFLWKQYKLFMIYKYFQDGYMVAILDFWTEQF